MKNHVRIHVLTWADIVASYALFVMQDYLTSVWNLSFTHAAGILNVWTGITMMLPAIFLYLADTLLGHFTMLVISSVSYSVGLGLVTLSTPPVLGDPCKRYEQECIGPKQKALFYAGMAFIAIGVSGNSVSVEPFLKEQQEGNVEPVRVTNEDDVRADHVEWKFVTKALPTIIVVSISIVEIFSPNFVKFWKLQFGIPTISKTVATIIFLSGIGVDPYKKVESKGKSPITGVFRVLYAFWFKLRQPDDSERYRRSPDEQQTHTTGCLRFLEKASIVTPGEIDEQGNVRNRWRLCSVAEVEDAKSTFRLIPMWLNFVVAGLISSVGNTYFVEQASNLNRRTGKWNVPLQIFMLIPSYLKLVADVTMSAQTRRSLYSGLKPFLCDPTVPYVYFVTTCAVAAKIEQKRLHVVRRHSLFNKPGDEIPMSVYWLLLQYFCLAASDSTLEICVDLFYKEQAPQSMEDYFKHFAKFVLGLGFMLNVLSVYIVGKISARNGSKNWFQKTLNQSRLDRYYWVLAGLAAVNLVMASVVYCNCYRRRKKTSEDAESID